MDIPTTDMDTITARGPLKPNPLTDTTAIPMPIWLLRPWIRSCLRLWISP